MRFPDRAAVVVAISRVVSAECVCLSEGLLPLSYCERLISVEFFLCL